MQMPAHWSLRLERKWIIRSTLTELCEAFNAHDLDSIMRVFSADCVLEMPRGSKTWGSRFEAKGNVREALATRFEGLPDIRYGNAEHLVDSTADLGISKWTLTGTTREGMRKEVLHVPKRQGDPQGLILEILE